MPTREEVHAGQAIYSPAVLRTYDWFVLGFSNRFLWRCPTSELLQLYERNLSPRHLDVGVGTGFFLDKARWPTPNPEITLLDLNPHCLRRAAARIRRFTPRTVTANVLEPLPAIGTFDSVALCYLLHCVPGSPDGKAAIFDHLAPHLASGARIFGATIVQGDAPRSRAAQKLMDLYNRKGIFSNEQDTAAALESALRSRFRDVTVSLRGTVALFEATADEARRGA